jgi:hypothetical protein
MLLEWIDCNQLKGELMRMKRFIGAATIFSLVAVGFCGVLFAQGAATPQQVMQKIKDAVAVLEKSKGADLADFYNPKGPWVFEDSYVVLQNCEQGPMASHPLVPTLVGKKAVGLQDVKGNFFFVQACEAGKKPGGGWIEYWFPKPGEKTPSRKLSYCLQVPGTPLVAIAGIYNDKLQLADLNKMVSAT